MNKALFFPNVDRYVFVASQLATQPNLQLHCPCTFCDKMLRLKILKKKNKTGNVRTTNIEARSCNHGCGGKQ